MRISTRALFAASVVLSLAWSAKAFSPIWNVDGWDKARLATAGISVRPWQNPLATEDSPLQWVQVTFDCGSLPKDQPVFMTARFMSDHGLLASAARAERAGAVDGKMTLTFCVTPEPAGTSASVDILIWSKTADGQAANGYELSMKRVAELARAERAAAAPAAK